MREKIRKVIDVSCDVMELLIAVVVGIALVMTAVGYILNQLGLWEIVDATSVFLKFLENMFHLVIGIEFIKMLLKPNAENVIEVLVFLIVRHMILGENKAWEILISVHCVIVLYGFNYLIHKRKKSNQSEEKDAAQLP